MGAGARPGAPGGVWGSARPGFRGLGVCGAGLPGSPGPGGLQGRPPRGLGVVCGAGLPRVWGSAGPASPGSGDPRDRPPGLPRAGGVWGPAGPAGVACGRPCPCPALEDFVAGRGARLSGAPLRPLESDCGPFILKKKTNKQTNKKKHKKSMNCPSDISGGRQAGDFEGRGGGRRFQGVGSRAQECPMWLAVGVPEA